MPAPPAPGIAVLEAIFLNVGQVAENTFHYHDSAGWTIAKLHALCNVYATWISGIVGDFTTNTQLIKLQARDLSSSSGAVFTENVSPPVVGTSAGEVLPNNVTFALARQTGMRGRANRGRVYLIGLPDTALDSSFQSVRAASADSLVGSFNTLLNNQLIGNGAQEVIYHKATGLGTPVIQYAYTDLFVDSQRRRLPGHNRHH